MWSSVVGSLRHMPARRLLAGCAALVAGGGAATAIAIAASSGASAPPRRPLAVAVHRALAAPEVPGLSARISFTNRLVDTGAVQGSDPLLGGGSGRLWIGSAGRFRVELQSDTGDAQIVSDGTTLLAFDPGMRRGVRVVLPAHHHPAGAARDQVPTTAEIQRTLTELAGKLSLSAATPGTVAGRAAYTVRVTPRRDGGLLGGAELAWDAARGVPLRAALYAVGSSTPVLELKATDISYGSVPASTFRLTPPPDIKVTDVTLRRSAPHAAGAKPVSGIRAARQAVPFTLSAPATLAGMPRRSVRAIGWGTHPAALVTYGRGLGGLAVVESAVTGRPATIPAPAGHDGAGLTLPTVAVGGATAQVLPTALGTVVRFTRGGVQYVVAGSVPPAVAEAAARGL